MMKLFALLGLIAAANAGAIFTETKVEAVPVTKTIIHGPSGEITKEEHVPVITHEPKILESPVVPYIVPSHAVTLEHHEVPAVQVVHPTEVVAPVHHEVVVHNELPLVHNRYLFRHALPYHTLPHVSPLHRFYNGLYYRYY